MAQPIPGLNLQVNLILSSAQTSAIFDPKFKPPKWVDPSQAYSKAKKISSTSSFVPMLS